MVSITLFSELLNLRQKLYLYFEQFAKRGGIVAFLQIVKSYAVNFTDVHIT